MVVLEYKSRDFSYSIREFQFGSQKRFFIYLYICCNTIFYQLAEKNSNPYPALSLNQAKKKLIKLLKSKCVGTPAEDRMKTLPIFEDEGYQEELFK